MQTHKKNPVKRTRIEVYEIARPENIATSGEWTRKLSAAEERKEIRYLMQWLDPNKFTYRVIYQ